LFRIWVLYNKAESIEKHEGFILIKSKSIHLPFSFLRGIFVKHDIEVENFKTILEHEKIHIKLLHTYDIVALDILHALFWFNPILIYYKKSIKLAHEYNVDRIITYNSNKEEYIHILLNSTQNYLQLSLCNHFFQSQISKRIHMIQNHQNLNSSRTSYLFTIPLIICLLYAMSPAARDIITSNQPKFSLINSLEITDTIPPENKKKKLPTKKVVESKPVIKSGKEDEELKKQINEDEIYDIVQQKPEFMPDSTGAGSEASLLNFMVKNLKYPEQAIKNNIEGRVIVKFVVDKTGKAIDPKIIRGIGGGCDEEAIKLINIMPRWKPGRHFGKNVNVTYTLPINFKLEGPKK
jgi:TonB family protein